METGILNVLFACLAAFAISRFFFEPIVTRSARKNLSEGRAGGAAWAALAQLTSKVALLATLSAALATGLIVWLQQSADFDLSQTNQLLDQISSSRDQVYRFNTSWGYLVTSICVTGLAWFAFVSTKAKEKELLSQSLDVELSRLQKELDDGDWEELSPTPDMQTLQRIMGQLEASFDRENTEGNEANANRIAEEYGKARQAHLYLDASRRANVSVDPRELGLKPKRSLADWIGSIFFSKGVVASLNGGSRVLVALGMLILVPSLLVATYQSTESSIEVEIERLEAQQARLEFDVQFAEIDREFQESLSYEPTASSELLDEELEAEITETARIFSSQIFPRMVARPIIVQVSQVDAAASKVSRNAARRQILEARASSGNGASVYGGSSSVEISGLIEAETPLTRKARSDLRAIASADPSALSRIRTNAQSAAKSFSTPTSPRHLQRVLISQFIGHAVDSTPSVPNIDTGISQQIKSVGSQISNVEAQRAYESAYKKFATEASKPAGEFSSDNLENWNRTPLSEKSERILSSGIGDIESTLNADSELNRNRPSIGRAPSYDVARARKAVQSLASRTQQRSGSAPTSFSQALTSFDDYFPGQQGADLVTPQAKAHAAIGGASSSTSLNSGSTSRSFARARSYGRLRGFSRVGGVLIGREPDNANEIISVQSIEWRRVQEKIELSASIDDSRTLLGRFNPTVVHLALAYAADGRPTTVTMVTAEPLPDLRIMLHPALEDTSLGCHAIRLDQLADGYGYAEGTALAEMRRAAEDQVRGEIGLYTLAWKARVRKLLPKARLTSEDRAYYSEASSHSSSVNELDEASRLVSSLSSDLMITNKPEFFDLSLIEIMGRCLPSASLSQFENCITNDYSIRVSDDNSISWLAPYPQYQIWSGVRELPFDVNSDFSFVDRSAHGPTWPFRFMVQVAFESEAYFAGDAENWSDKVNMHRDDYVDTDPWELKVVGKEITQAIELASRRDRSLRSNLDYMSEFAVLQRLFRAALDGNLGDNLEIQSLVDLATATKDDLKGNVTTAKWLRQPGQLERSIYNRASTLIDAQSNQIAIDRLRAGLMRCIVLISTAAETNETTSLEAISQSAWNDACVFSGELSQFGSQARELEEWSELVSGIREIRSVTGATTPRSIEYPDNTGSCPIP